MSNGNDAKFNERKLDLIFQSFFISLLLSLQTKQDSNPTPQTCSAEVSQAGFHLDQLTLFSKRQGVSNKNRWGAPKRICLRLPLCSPRFESQTHHLCFFQFIQFKLYICHLKGTKTNKKRPGLAYLKNKNRLPLCTYLNDQKQKTDGNAKILAFKIRSKFSL